MENAQLVSLKEHLESRINALEKQVLAAMDASEKAITKAELAAEKRFEGVNEFRSSLDDSNKLNARQTEVDHRFNSMNEKVERLTKEMDSQRDVSRGRGDVWGWVGGGIIGLIVALLLVFVQGISNPPAPREVIREVPREIIREVPKEVPREPGD
jgi:tetrahydromethanopterin S-methyltransferase subunit G